MPALRVLPPRAPRPPPSLSRVVCSVQQGLLYSGTSLWLASTLSASISEPFVFLERRHPHPSLHLFFCALPSPWACLCCCIGVFVVSGLCVFLGLKVSGFDQGRPQDPVRARPQWKRRESIITVTVGVRWIGLCCAWQMCLDAPLMHRQGRRQTGATGAEHSRVTCPWGDALREFNTPPVRHPGPRALLREEQVACPLSEERAPIGLNNPLKEE